MHASGSCTIFSMKLLNMTPSPQLLLLENSDALCHDSHVPDKDSIFSFSSKARKPLSAESSVLSLPPYSLRVKNNETHRHHASAKDSGDNKCLDSRLGVI